MRVKFLTRTEPLVENCWSKVVTGSLIAGFGRTRLLICVRMLTTYTSINRPIEGLERSDTRFLVSILFLTFCSRLIAMLFRPLGSVTFARTFSAGLASFKRTGHRKVLSVFSNWASLSAKAKRSSTLSSSSTMGG